MITQLEQLKLKHGGRLDHNEIRRLSAQCEQCTPLHRSSLIPLQRLSFNIKANYLTVSVAQCMYDMGLDKDNGHGIAKVEGREAWHLTEVILSVNFINPVIPFSKFAQRCFQLRQVYIYLGLYSGTFSSSVIHPPPPPSSSPLPSKPYPLTVYLYMCLNPLTPPLLPLTSVDVTRQTSHYPTLNMHGRGNTIILYTNLLLFFQIFFLIITLIQLQLIE